jgi:hypothetical protein
MAWNSTNPWVNINVGIYSPYTITVYLTTSSTSAVGAGTLLGSWTGIPGQVSAQPLYSSFASTAYNQYQSFAVRGLASSTAYYIAFDFNVEPGVQTRNVGLDLASFTYYSTV